MTITPLGSLDLVRRYARVEFDGARVPATAAVGSSGTRRRRRRASAPARDRHPDRGDGRRRADGLRLHARVDVQPVLVRSAARVVPEPEAPLRRHEDVARGEPRARGGDGAGSAGRGAERRRDGQRGQGLHRRLPRRARAGLRADARWHRRHLRPRHPPVPPARHRRPRHARHAGRSPAANHRTCARRTRHDHHRERLCNECHRHGERRVVPRACARMAGREHREGRNAGRRLPHRRDRRRGARPDRAGARAPEEVLRSRFRRHLLPDGVRRPGPLARAPARVQRGGRRLPVPEHPPDPDVRAVRGGPAGVRYRGTEEAPPPEDHERRRDLDAVPLRAQWWFRRRRRAHHRDPRRRRVGRQRLEDLDDGRVVLRLRALPAPHQLGRAEAPRPECVHHQDPPAEHRAAPHRDDQRVAGVLPGVHDRPAGSRQRPRRRGRPGLDRRHPLDVPRAQRDGRRLAVRERADASSQWWDRSARSARRARRARPGA